MSFQTYVVSKLTALNEWVNQVSANSKRIDELPDATTGDKYVAVWNPDAQSGQGQTQKQNRDDFVDQDNVAVFKYIPNTNPDVEPTVNFIVEKLNNTPNGTLILTDKRTPILLYTFVSNEVSPGVYAPYKKNIYVFSGGKGRWGYGGGTPVHYSMILELGSVNIGPADINPDDDTDIIALGNIGTQDQFLTEVNSEARDFTDENKSYYFSYYITENGQDVLYITLFKGAPGDYGGITGNDFVETDFVSITNSNTPATTPQSNDLPEDFVFASMTNTDIVDNQYVGVEHRAMYITDTYRYLNLDDWVPNLYGTFASVEIVGNDIHFLYYANTDGAGNYDAFGHAVLKNCKIINNILVPESSDYQLFVDGSGNSLIHPGSGGTVTSAKVHCEDYSDGWIYYATRVPSTATGYTQIIKLNANNIHDFQIEDVFLGGGLSNIVVVDNWIYAVKQDDNTVFPTGNLVRIPINNIGTYEVLTQLGTNPLHKLTSQGPFQIYLGEVFVQTHRDSSLSSDPNYSKSLGIQVYSLSGKLLRENADILAYPNATTGATNIHWLDIFNGKIIGHSVIGSGTNDDLKRLIRINSTTLELEETVPVLNSEGTSVKALTDDNYISRNGKIYLSNESGSSGGVAAALLNWRLLIVEDYKDFTTINNTGFYFKGTGMVGTYIPRKALFVNSENSSAISINANEIKKIGKGYTEDGAGNVTYNTGPIGLHETGDFFYAIDEQGYFIMPMRYGGADTNVFPADLSDMYYVGKVRVPLPGETGYEAPE